MKNKNHWVIAMASFIFAPAAFGVSVTFSNQSGTASLSADTSSVGSVTVAENFLNTSSTAPINVSSFFSLSDFQVTGTGDYDPTTGILTVDPGLRIFATDVNSSLSEQLNFSLVNGQANFQLDLTTTLNTLELIFLNGFTRQLGPVQPGDVNFLPGPTVNLEGNTNTTVDFTLSAPGVPTESSSEEVNESDTVLGLALQGSTEFNLNLEPTRMSLFLPMVTSQQTSLSQSETQDGITVTINVMGADTTENLNLAFDVTLDEPLTEVPVPPVLIPFAAIVVGLFARSRRILTLA